MAVMADVLVCLSPSVDWVLSVTFPATTVVLVPACRGPPFTWVVLMIVGVAGCFHSTDSLRFCVYALDFTGTHSF